MFTRIRADSIRRAFQGVLVLWVVGLGSRCPTAMVAWAQGTNDPPPIDAAEESTRSPRSPGDGRLGEAPEDTSQLFLRQAAVLLKPGEMQFDHGLTYSLQEVIHPTVLSDGTLSAERVRTRQWLVPLAIRLGLKENVQGFIDLPFGYTHIESADLEFDDFAKTFGSRDVTGGVSALLRQE